MKLPIAPSDTPDRMFHKDVGFISCVPLGGGVLQRVSLTAHVCVSRTEDGRAWPSAGATTSSIAVQASGYNPAKASWNYDQSQIRMGTVLV